MFRFRLLLVFVCCLFFKTGFANEIISYVHKDVSLNEIFKNNENWIPYKKEMNNGLDNGVYWFKIELEALNVERVIRIPESHITRTQLFSDGIEIDLVQPKRYVTYEIPKLKQKKTYYLKVDCLLESRIPIEILNINEYYSIIIKEYIFIALYYGIVIAILLFNLFSYISFKIDAYLYYMFMVIGMTINPFYKDGLFAYFFGINGIHEIIELYTNLIIVIANIVFTKSYLGIDKKYNIVRKIGIAITFLCLISAIVFQVTRSFPVFVFTNGLELLALDCFWLYGVFLWKKNINARFYIIGYTIPLIVGHDFYFSPYFGFSLFHVSFGFYKMGSLFEMIIFSYAIVYFAKCLISENKKHLMKIEEISSSTLKKTVINYDAILITKYYFTATEIKILKLISDNYTNKMIAEKSYVSENTVKFHLKNIYNKLDVKNRNDAKLKYEGLN